MTAAKTWVTSGARHARCFDPSADLLVYGASDDLVYVEGVDSGEIPAREVTFVSIIDPHTSTGAVIAMMFTNVGVWTAMVSQLGEGVPIPWPITITDGRGAPGSRHATDAGYSVAVVVHDCKGATIAAKDSVGADIEIS
jgi:hypothetical protein